MGIPIQDNKLTYNEYKTHMKSCEFLGKPPMGEYAKIQGFITRIWEDIHFNFIHEVPNPRTITAYKNGNILFTVNTWNREVMCDSQRSVSYLTEHLNLGHNTARELMEDIIKDHLSISDIHVTIYPTHITTKVKTELVIGLP